MDKIPEDVLIIDPVKWGTFVNARQFKSISGITFTPQKRITYKIPQYNLRGLTYFKEPYDCNTKVKVTKGNVFCVAVDIRPTSSSYGKYISCVLGDRAKRIMYIPKGFARGFYAFEDSTVVMEHDADVDETQKEGIAYDDIDLRIKWTNTSFYFPPKIFLHIDESSQNYQSFREYKKKIKNIN